MSESAVFSTNTEPVDHQQIVRNIGITVVAGAAVAVATVFFARGPRTGLTTVGTFIVPLLALFCPSLKASVGPIWNLSAPQSRGN